jgi:thiamine biosynthesis lipoprotein
MPQSKKSKPTLASSPAIFEFEAIGTKWLIEIFDDVSKEQTGKLFKAIVLRIDTFDHDYSRFRADSLVTRMSQKAGTYQLPADGKKLLDFYYELYMLSNGLVTPLIGKVLSDAGYDAEYSLLPKKLHQPPTWDDVITYTGTTISLKQPALLDFGAAGKGYLVDLVSQIIENYGVQNYCVDAGGDIYQKRDIVTQVGLEHPADPELAIGVVNLQNQALCGSAGNRRAWGGYNHIMDPAKLVSPNHIQAVWVTAKSAMLADGLTTALYFVPAKELKKRYTFEYAIVGQNYSLEHSPNFPAEFFS